MKKRKTKKKQPIYPCPRCGEEMQIDIGEVFGFGQNGFPFGDYLGKEYSLECLGCGLEMVSNAEKEK